MTLPLSPRCPACATPAAVGQKFCSNCGKPLREQTAAESSAYTPPHLRRVLAAALPGGERRFVTVLFCDIADSTTIAQTVGPDAMHAMLSDFFSLGLDEVHATGGVVNQFLGDGFMALFGAPIAYEDHVRRALSAAIRLRDRTVRATRERHPQLPEIRLRIGVHTGPVLVGGIGDALRMDYTAIGDTTNVAARLQALAQPGTILVSDDTFTIAQQWVHGTPVGDAVLKGRSQATALVRVEGLAEHGAQRAPERGRTPLFGRDNEVHLLEEELQGLLTGSSRCILLAGAAGAGKSRLLEHLRTLAASAGIACHEARGSTLDGAVPYAAFQQLLTSILRGRKTNPGETASVIRDGLYRLLGPDAAAAEPFVLHLLGEGQAPGGLPLHDPAAMAQQIYRWVYMLINRAADTAPVVLLLDDWQWADAASSTLLRHLLSLGGSPRTLFVVASRPDLNPYQTLVELPPSFPLRPRLVDVASLPRAAVLQLCRHLLGRGQLAPAIERRVWDITQGNPLFVRELTHALLQGDMLVYDAASAEWYTRGAVENLVLPASVEGVILARFDLLSAPAKQLLRIASVFGMEATERDLEHAHPELAVSMAAEEANASGFIVRTALADGESKLAFLHLLVQHAVYGSIPELPRRNMHARVAEALLAGDDGRQDGMAAAMAHHLAEAHRWEEAVPYLLRAGQQAAAIAANQEALSHMQRALAASRSGAVSLPAVDLAVMNIGIGEALQRLGRHDVATQHLVEAVRLLGYPYPRSEAELKVALRREVILLAGSFLRTRAGAGGSPQAALLAFRALELLAYMDVLRNEVRAAHNVLLAIRITERLPASAEHVRGNVVLGLLLDFTGRPTLAGPFHGRAWVRARDSDNDSTLGGMYFGQGMHAIARGKPIEALGLLDLAAAHLEKAGDLRNWSSARSTKRMALRALGDPSFCDGLEEHKRLAEEAKDDHARAICLNFCGSRDLHLKQWSSAALHLQEAGEIFAAIPDFRFLAAALSMHSVALARQGDNTGAAARLDQMEEIVARRIAGPHATTMLMKRAEAYVLVAEEERDTPSAGRWLDRASAACRDLHRQGRHLRDDGAPEALRLEGICLWLQGRTGAAQRAWLRGLDKARTNDARYIEARLHEELALRGGLRAHLSRANGLYAVMGWPLAGSLVATPHAGALTQRYDGGCRNAP